jgi:MHS family proline/betaine transporter-like MFS transporter
MGFMADKFGKERVMIVAVISSFCLSLPIFLFLNYENSLINVFIVLILFGFFMSAVVAPSIAFLPTLFPIQERYSAMAIAIGVGEAVGGATPLICHGFVVAMGTPIAPAFYLMICSFLAWVSIKYSKPNNKNFETIKFKLFPFHRAGKKFLGTAR